VLVAELVPSQPEVFEHAVNAKMRRWWHSTGSGDVYIFVVREGDVLRVIDGHTRLARERALGRKWTWARVFEP
jgi:hypothetical protein